MAADGAAPQPAAAAAPADEAAQRCYCDKPVEFDAADRVRCSDCGVAFHWEHVPAARALPGAGDERLLAEHLCYLYTCARCAAPGAERLVCRGLSWLEATHLVLYTLSVRRSDTTFFHVRGDICALIDRHWDVLFCGKQRSATWQNTVSSVLSSHPERFVTGATSQTKQLGHWRLRAVAPPPPAARRSSLAPGTSPARHAVKIEPGSAVKIEHEPAATSEPESAANIDANPPATIDSYRAIATDSVPPVVADSGPSVVADSGPAVSTDSSPAIKAEAEPVHDASDGDASESAAQQAAPAVKVEPQPSAIVGASWSDDEDAFETKGSGDGAGRKASRKGAIDKPPAKRRRKKEPAADNTDPSQPQQADTKRKRKRSSVAAEAAPPPMPPPQLNQLEEWNLIGRLTTCRATSPAAARLLRKLELRRVKRAQGLPLFDIDERTAASLLRTNDYQQILEPLTDELEAPAPAPAAAPPAAAPAPAAKAAGPGSGSSSSGGGGGRAQSESVESTLPRRFSFAERLCGRPDGADTLTHLEVPVMRSSYTDRLLKPFIRRDFDCPAPRLRLLRSLPQFAREAEVRATPLYPVDYCYMRPEHLAEVNSLLSSFFWPGIDMSEALENPEFTVVACYRRLVIGCAFMTPGAYISYVLVRPDWRGGGIGRFMVYHLLQTIATKDVTLHVAATNPALLLYQQFGFKAEQFIVNFYENYYPDDTSECKNALFLRRRR